MAFKKDLTSIGRKGRVDTQRGKGSTTQRTAPRERETLTGGNPMERMMNKYPAAAQPPSNAPPARPADLAPQPTAAMPSAPAAPAPPLDSKV